MKDIKQIKKFSTILFLLIFLLSLILNNNVIASSNSYRDSSCSKAGDIIYFEKPDNWSDSIPHIYAWKQDTSDTLGIFPGEEMVLVEDNLYKYEFTSNVGFDKIIFSDGADQSIKTSDLNFICSGYYYKNDDATVFNCQFVTLKAGDTISFVRPNSWNAEGNVCIYLWNSETNNSVAIWDDRDEMTKVSENLYTYTLPEKTPSEGINQIIFTDGKSDGTKQSKNLSLLASNLIFIGDETPLQDGTYDGFWALEDKSKLHKLITETTIPDGDEVYYTKESYSLYKAQYDLAKVLDNTQYVATTYFDYASQYDKSLLGLRCTYDHLVLNPQILKDKIEEMKEVDTTKYNPEIVKDFEDEIKNAEEIVNNQDNLTINIIKDEIKRLEDVKNKLIVDKTELEDLIDEAENIDTTKYTDETVKILIDEIEKAKQVYNNNDATYQEVKDEIDKLNEAINQLKLVENENIQSSQQENKVSDEETITNSNSNPHTGDMILIAIGVLTIALATIIATNKIKNNKNK